MLGGLGFSYYSYIGRYLNTNDVHLTFEGDNKILLTQTVRFILKNTQKIITGKKFHPSLSYIKEYFEDQDKAKSFTDDFKDIDNLKKILKANVSMVITYQLIIQLALKGI